MGRDLIPVFYLNFRFLSAFQTTNEGYTLSSANRLYTNVGFRIKADYSKAVKDNFLAEVEQLDFAQNVASAGTINAWVEETTHGKIKDLIPPGMVKKAANRIKSIHHIQIVALVLVS